MIIPLDYSFEERLKSFSQRLKYIANENNAYFNHNDQNITAENLRYNLSLTLSHIILNLSLVDRSRTAFETVIEQYNKTHNTKLVFKDFEEIYWIRIVANEVVLPAVVSSFMWKVGHYEKENKPLQIPAGKEHLVHCLQFYYLQCFEDVRPSISEATLINLLGRYAASEVDIKFLVARGILLKVQNDVYVWKSNDYIRYLKNEIASTLWILVTDNRKTVKEFEQFLKLCQAVELYNYDLSRYLTNEQQAKISELSFSFLKREKDFNKSKNEFPKVWLDAQNYHHIEISTPAPSVDFDYSDIYNFVQSVRMVVRRYQDLFHYQFSRSFSYGILNIISKNEPQYGGPYRTLLQLLRDLKKPFLAWTLYCEITRLCPEIIPYLLNDPEIAPLAFNLIEKLPVNDDLLQKYVDRDLKEEERFKILNELYQESFILLLDLFSSFHSPHSDYTEYAKSVTRILLDCITRVFEGNPNNKYIAHNAYRKRYDELLALLGKKRLKAFSSYTVLSIRPRLVIKLLPGMLKYLIDAAPKIYGHNNDVLSLGLAYIDVSIEALRLAKLNFTEGEIVKEEREAIDQLSSELTKKIFDYLISYYSEGQVYVKSFNNKEGEYKTGRRNANMFGYEIVDWGYLILLFEREGTLEKFYEDFIKTQNFKNEMDRYDEQNREEEEKLKCFVKSLLLAYISIITERSKFDIEQLPVAVTLKKLERWIRELALQHSVYDLSKGRIDLFDERFVSVGKNLYYAGLRTLLFRSINYFDSGNASKFISDFFAHSIDIGSMLAAVNIFEDKNFRKIVSERISTIQIDDYVDSRATIIELQDAMVEAINSESQWELAKPLIERFQAHLARFDKHNKNAMFLLFNVNLLLALKENDIDKLNNVDIPEKEYQIYKEDDWDLQLKSFFIALHNLYNEKNFDEAILIFEALLSKDDKPKYAYHLFRARTLKALETSDIGLLGNANRDWEAFNDGLSDEKKSELSELKFAIASNQLNYYAFAKDYLRFDQNLNILSKPFLYDSEIVPLVYKQYTERGMDKVAFNYINEAILYMSNNGTEIQAPISELRENSETKGFLSDIKQSLINLRSLSANNLPSTTPDVVNDKRNINDFILSEFVQASQVMVEKIEGIAKNPHEDRFNDLFLAILRLRFQIWGWSIHDQARKGSSPTGKNAGETDITIECGNLTIALVEALILKGKSKGLTHSHIQKMFTYAKNLDRYYVVVYYKGPPANFDKTWVSYKSDFEDVAFKPEYVMDMTLGFIDLNAQYSNVTCIKLAKTNHGAGIQIFHIMIDLSTK